MTPVSAAGRIGTRMDRPPLGRFHRLLLALIGGRPFPRRLRAVPDGRRAECADAQRLVEHDLQSSFVSATFVGRVFGAWAAGICGDRFGRRFTYQSSLLIFGGASLVAAFAPNVETLIGLRVVMGLGLGAEVVVG